MRGKAGSVTECGVTTPPTHPVTARPAHPLSTENGRAERSHDAVWTWEPHKGESGWSMKKDTREKRHWGEGCHTPSLLPPFSDSGTDSEMTELWYMTTLCSLGIPKHSTSKAAWKSLSLDVNPGLIP